MPNNKQPLQPQEMPEIHTVADISDIAKVIAENLANKKPVPYFIHYQKLAFECLLKITDKQVYHLDKFNRPMLELMRNEITRVLPHSDIVDISRKQRLNIGLFNEAPWSARENIDPNWFTNACIRLSSTDPLKEPALDTTTLNEPPSKTPRI